MSNYEMPERGTPAQVVYQLEPLQSLRVRGKLLPQGLYGDVAPQFEALGAVDVPYTTPSTRVRVSASGQLGLR